MAAMLRNSVVVVAVVRTRPRAILLALITTRNSIHGFSLLSWVWGSMRLFGQPELCYDREFFVRDLNGFGHDLRSFIYVINITLTFVM